jgi:gliding motility-associated-like protein
LNAAEPITFTWSNGGTTAKLDSLTKGTYNLAMKDSLGCMVDTTFEVKVLCDLKEEEFIPDTYSPNGDGFNDIWNIPMLDQFPENRVRIFNRWGALIYDWESGTFQGWNGTNSKGEEMPIGAYFYVIELNSPKTDRVFKGSVTIIR